MNNNQPSTERFLPIGTIVMLRGGKKRMMIIGYCPIAEENQEKVYDYSGCLFPEGVISSEQTLLFDHNQIEKIYAFGLIDDEQKQFNVKLNEAYKQQYNK